MKPENAVGAGAAGTLTSPDIRPVRAEDYGELCDFLSRFPPGETRTPAEWAERLRFWWDRNPAFSENVPRGWTLYAGGRIAGFIGAIPALFETPAGRITATIATTWRVVPEERGHSLKLFRQWLNFASETLSLCTTPAPHVARVFEKMDYRRIPYASRQSFRLLVFPERTVLRRWGKNPASRAAAFCLRGLARVQERLLGSPPAGLSAEEHSEAGPAFDLLWKRAGSRYSVTRVRNAEVLQWFCFGSRAARKRLFSCSDATGLRAALIAVTRESAGRRVLECVDYWGDDDLNVLCALLVKAAACARSEACESVIVPAFSSPVARCLFRLLGIGWRHAARCEYYRWKAAEADLVQATGAVFSYAEGDIGL